MKEIFHFSQTIICWIPNVVQQVIGIENTEQNQLYFSALSGSGKLGVT